jgi:hypothetical protein
MLFCCSRIRYVELFDTMQSKMRAANPDRIE